jgi:UDP:flavonoid glycosyltransferase YjiC (YdhE family)
MLSGSRFGSPVAFSRHDWPYRIDVVGRPAPDGWTQAGVVHFHGKLRDNRELVHAADLVVINGGFSAVSESFAMRKPMIVVPVPNHAEQWINGRTMVKLGVGMMADEDGIEAAIEAAARRMESFRAAYDRISHIPDGTGQAAQAILEAAANAR